MSGVTDILPIDKPLLTDPESRLALLASLKRDLDFLADLECIDYSVLVVRPPDGRNCRLALIDVFWSLRTPRAKVTKKASDAAGLPQQTVTADARGYADETFRLVESVLITTEQWDARQSVRQDTVLVDL
jgi:hypothetical protein